MTAQNDKNSPLDRLEDYIDLLREPSAEECLAPTESVRLREGRLEHQPPRRRLRQDAVEECGP